jgi:hypothetical protein
MPLWHFVVAEVGCNWYNFDINIFSLLKNSVWRSTRCTKGGIIG